VRTALATAKTTVARAYKKLAFWYVLKALTASALAKIRHHFVTRMKAAWQRLQDFLKNLGNRTLKVSTGRQASTGANSVDNH
jgi:hypothetical protein